MPAQLYQFLHAPRRLDHIDCAEIFLKTSFEENKQTNRRWRKIKKHKLCSVCRQDFSPAVPHRLIQNTCTLAAGHNPMFLHTVILEIFVSD